MDLKWIGVSVVSLTVASLWIPESALAGTIGPGTAFDPTNGVEVYYELRKGDTVSFPDGSSTVAFRTRSVAVAFTVGAADVGRLTEIAIPFFITDESSSGGFDTADGLATVSIRKGLGESDETLGSFTFNDDALGESTGQYNSGNYLIRTPSLATVNLGGQNLFLTEGTYFLVIETATEVLGNWFTKPAALGDQTSASYFLSDWSYLYDPFDLYSGNKSFDLVTGTQLAYSITTQAIPTPIAFTGGFTLTLPGLLARKRSRA